MRRSLLLSCIFFCVPAFATSTLELHDSKVKDSFEKADGIGWVNRLCVSKGSACLARNAYLKLKTEGCDHSPKRDVSRGAYVCESAAHGTVEVLQDDRGNENSVCLFKDQTRIFADELSAACIR